MWFNSLRVISGKDNDERNNGASDESLKCLTRHFSREEYPEAKLRFRNARKKDFEGCADGWATDAPMQRMTGWARRDPLLCWCTPVNSQHIQTFSQSLSKGKKEGSLARGEVEGLGCLEWWVGCQGAWRGQTYQMRFEMI